MAATAIFPPIGGQQQFHAHLIEVSPKSRPLGKQSGLIGFTVLCTVAAFLALPWIIYQGFQGNWLLILKMILLTWVGFVISGLGITVGYHRLKTHDSFETETWVGTVLLMMGASAAQGKPLKWIVDHYIHHLFTDILGFDPHTPKEGFWRAHWAWTWMYPTPGLEYYSRRFANDPAIKFVSKRYVWIPCVVAPFVIGFLIGGWDGLFWLGFVRLGFLYHVTWAINSVCHKWGTRLYETPDESKNNRLVAWLALGEGNHNNHHAFPNIPMHGDTNNDPDLSWRFICVLKQAGLAWGINVPTPEQKEDMRRSLLELQVSELSRN